MTDQDSTKAVDRSRFRLIQTPQTFDVALIKQAYQLKEDASMTDDASVAERSGHVISLFEGSYENIKITTPEDLVIAEALLNSRKVDVK
jgi:2-C-methyl-D-erythritol 4-phosphate cytidylyltransferase